jgi:hypothetical protein
MLGVVVEAVVGVAVEAVVGGGVTVALTTLVIGASRDASGVGLASTGEELDPNVDPTAGEAGRGVGVGFLKAWISTLGL